MPWIRQITSAWLIDYLPVAPSRDEIAIEPALGPGGAFEGPPKCRSAYMLGNRPEGVGLLRPALGAGHRGVDRGPGLIDELAGTGAGLGEAHQRGAAEGDAMLATANPKAHDVGLGAGRADPDREPGRPATPSDSS